jgi:hypothetical protein
MVGGVRWQGGQKIYSGTKTACDFGVAVVGVEYSSASQEGKRLNGGRRVVVADEALDGNDDRGGSENIIHWSERWIGVMTADQGEGGSKEVGGVDRRENKMEAEWIKPKKGPGRDEPAG